MVMARYKEKARNRTFYIPGQLYHELSQEARASYSSFGQQAVVRLRRALEKYPVEAKLVTAFLAELDPSRYGIYDEAERPSVYLPGSLEGALKRVVAEAKGRQGGETATVSRLFVFLVERGAEENGNGVG
jgi:hypothetical protein